MEQTLQTETHPQPPTADSAWMGSSRICPGGWGLALRSGSAVVRPHPFPYVLSVAAFQLQQQS